MSQGRSSGFGGDFASRGIFIVTSMMSAGERSSSSRPVILEIPDGFVFQLWSKQRVELGQNRDQPKEIAANRTGHQHGYDNSSQGTASSPSSLFGPQQRKWGMKSPKP